MNNVRRLRPQFGIIVGFGHAAEQVGQYNYDDRHFVTFMTEWMTRMRFVQKREHARNLF